MCIRDRVVVVVQTKHATATHNPNQISLSILRGNHVYVGLLLDGIPHGEGTITFSDGQTFKTVFDKGA